MSSGWRLPTTRCPPPVSLGAEVRLPRETSPMRNPAVLYPVLALVAWTFLVMLTIPLARVRAARRREVVVDDFKFGESASVPPHVSIPNRNYMNLLELPSLFYVACV